MRQWQHATYACFQGRASAPAVTLEAIFIQCTIFAHEQLDVASCDIPGAFKQVDNPDFLLMHLDGILAELMVKVTPKLYRKYITTNAKQKPVLFVQLEKAVYGIYEKCSTILLKIGCRSYFSGFCYQSL
jgi:hypothetical protein